MCADCRGFMSKGDVLQMFCQVWMGLGKGQGWVGLGVCALSRGVSRGEKSVLYLFSSEFKEGE